MSFSPRTAGRPRPRRIDGGHSIGACERTAISYCRNILVGTRIARVRQSLLEDLVDDEIALAALRSIDGQLVQAPGADKKQLWDRFRALVTISRPPLEPPPSPENPVSSNIRLLAEVVGLSAVETAVFQFFTVLHLVSPLASMTSLLGTLSLLGAAEVCGAAIALGRDAVLTVLGPSGLLSSSGLLLFDEDPANLSYKITLKGGIIDLLLIPQLTRALLFEHLLPVAPPTTLATEDYAHLAAEVVLARSLLDGALRERRPGVNVLFYGATGTGKSELARLLAQAVGTSLHVAGNEDEYGESPSPKERLASLLLGNRLLASGRSLLLFDELEDLFERNPPGAGSGGGERRDRAAPSKLWFNLLLENNAVPTIWITNDPRGMDPAFRRRFSYAVEFRPLGVAQRRRVWSRHLGSSTALDGHDVEHLATRFTVSPGQIATVLHAARLAAGGEPDRGLIERVVAPLEKLVRGVDARPVRVLDAKDYLFEAANASVDLRALADQLAGWRPGAALGVSLCLYGPPGTGKSEFVHHLGRRMDRPVVVRRVSDIVSKWLGESEQNIAEAFAEADDDGAILLFDEADSFLRDRRGALHSWEVTQVNEFLQQLEAYRGLVVCTTNLHRHLDQASLRRFVFKIEFGYIDAVQARLLFRSMLEPLLADKLDAEDERTVERELARLTNLTPGDFAIVVRRLRLRETGVTADVPTVAGALAELRSEAAAKERDGTRPLGFAR